MLLVNLRCFLDVVCTAINNSMLKTSFNNQQYWYATRTDLPLCFWHEFTRLFDIYDLFFNYRCVICFWILVLTDFHVLASKSVCVGVDSANTCAHVCLCGFDGTGACMRLQCMCCACLCRCHC